MRIGQGGMLLVVAGILAGSGVGWGQTAAPAKTKKAQPARKKTVVIPLETAPPSPPASPAVEAQQKAADQKLLEEQKRQSEQAAQVTNQQVEKAQKQQENVQKEVRIQDAPGPVQTGVVPAAGAPVAPASGDQRIQDAPGPAQTLPQPKVVTPPPL